jgi:serine/threonine-protein kinase
VNEALRGDVEPLLAADADAVSRRLPVVAQAVLADAPGLPTEPATAARRYIGQYEITALLGAGAMGEVYRARDTKLNREVALKVLPPLLARDPDRLARFRREAQMLAALNHPNIAAIYGLEESEGVQALVLELVDGPTLADQVARGPLPWTRRSPSDARSPLPSKRHTRRASFIAISSRRTSKSPAAAPVKVLDFGLAKVWEGASVAELSGSPTLTATSMAKG